MAQTSATAQHELEAPGQERLGEFDCVRLLEDLSADEAAVVWLNDDDTADRIVAGATGAIVHTHAEGGPFEVEFTEPVAAVATVRKDQLVRIWKDQRARL